MAEAGKAKEPKEPKVVYAVNSPPGLNVREAPSKAAKVLRVLKHGETVEQAGKAPKGWVAIKGGYVMAEYLK